MPQTQDIVTLTDNGTLCELLAERVKRSPDAVAYRQYEESADDWVPWTWRQFADAVSRWQQALSLEGLQAGDRVAVMLGNSREWAAFDMAALGLGLVVVPLFVNDRADNVGLILEDCGARLLLVGADKQWQTLAPIEERLKTLDRVLSVEAVSSLPGGFQPMAVADWLPPEPGELRLAAEGGDALATIVYTSGTTGQPKGVMLSHRNILFNVVGVLDKIHAYREDLFLSFLPLSHMLERTGGYYLPMAAGSTSQGSRRQPALRGGRRRRHGPGNRQVLQPTGCSAR